MTTDNDSDSRKMIAEDKYASPDHYITYYEAEAFALTAWQVRGLTARMIEEEHQRIRRAMAQLEDKKHSNPDYVK